MANIKDIAKKAEVSTATVSHVLNSTGRVGEETRKKVLKVIEELDYKPNKIAKSLKMKRTKTIGVIAEDVTVFNTPEIIDGINEFAETKGYSISLVNLRLYKRIGTNFAKVGELKEMVNSVISQLTQNQVEGIIYIGTHPRDVTNELPALNIPVVYTYCYTTNQEDYSVNYDDESAAAKATKYLIDKGHQKIALISGLIDSLPSHNRFNGFRMMLAENGISFNPSFIKTGDWEIDSGFELTRELFKQDQKPTAIMALNDLMAVGAVKALNQLGLRVPEDISVIGFDNREFSAFIHPQLTTMSIPLHEMGEKAMEILYYLVNGQAMPNEHKVYLPCELVMRNSVSTNK